MSSQSGEAVQTKRRVLGQVVVCVGCCCGQTDKGRALVPEARIKSAWKAEKLSRTIQLTISGCVGPCDVANVAQIITPNGIIWLGRLSDDAHYDALIGWARACDASKAVVPIPSALEQLRFDGYIAEVNVG
jgi:cobaltochelatase CobN